MMTPVSPLHYETARRARLKALLEELARVHSVDIRDLVAAVASTAPPGWPLDIGTSVANPTFDLLADALENGEVSRPSCTCPPPADIKPGPPGGDGYATGVVVVTKRDCPVHGQDGVNTTAQSTAHAEQPTVTPLRYTARFQPEAWIKDDAVPVDPEGSTEWDCTAFVNESTLAYLQGMGERRDESLKDPVFGVLDNDDVFKDDPAAPVWVRDWRGPSTVRVFVADAA